ncbi:MAG TPA: hypothetical protein VF053_18765 [Streptosporangiales bacterium]
MNYHIVEQQVHERISQMRAEADSDRKAYQGRPRRHRVRHGGHHAGLRVFRRATA